MAITSLTWSVNITHLCPTGHRPRHGAATLTWQVTEFVTKYAPEIHKEMMHLERLEKMYIWKLLRWLKDRGVVEFMFVLAVAQNVGWRRSSSSVAACWASARDGETCLY